MPASRRPGRGDHLRELEHARQEARLDFHQRRRILARAWETAVEGAPEDDLLSLDEENALAKYADYFSLDRHGVQTSAGTPEPVLEQVVGLELGEEPRAFAPTIPQYPRYGKPGILVENALRDPAQEGEG